jgi:hypothetical protein
MNRCLSYLLVLLFALALAPPAAAHNPKPAKGDLVIPMPKGQEMVFRPVSLGAGDSLFAWKRFTLGDPSGGFKENPTKAALGGSFISGDQGKKEWVYYLGKYEVTRAQYYSLMEPPKGISASELKSSKPINSITWFQAMQFVDRLNQWLYKNHRDSLPQYGGSPGFLRLPLEEEWEFAARGGAEVSPDEFDRKLPFSGNPAAYEWYSGPKSSHNKLKKSGVLKPNPLGLHDMLGNVAEMTHSLYRVEYYQGRPGGFVSRGGHFFTSRKKLRASLRTEEPFYLTSAKKPPRPNQKPTLGMRLAISSLVFPNRNTAKEMSSAWDEYRKGSGADTPAQLSTAPAVDRTVSHGSDMATQLAKLKKSLARVKIPQEAKRHLARLESSLGNIETIQREAEEDSAYAWVKIAAERGYFVFLELKKLPTMQKLVSIARQNQNSKRLKLYNKRIKDYTSNIRGALDNYSASFRQLTNIRPGAVKKGFKRYLGFLQKAKAPRAQNSVVPLVRKHYLAFRKTRRSDPALWRRELGDIKK